MTTYAPYGTWKSEISFKSLVEGAVAFRNIEIDGEDLYYLESRPQEKGRSVFVAYATRQDLFPTPFNARTLVHEYGGKCGIIYHKILYFSNYADQQVYQVSSDGIPEKLTHEEKMRFGDFCIHPSGKWMYAVYEDHSNPSKTQNGIAKIDLFSGAVTPLCFSHDFYMAPRVNPQGDRLALLAWNHPNMPWDGTQLLLCDLNSDGLVQNEEEIAGGASESVLEPSWSPEGRLYYVSDRTGYWNLYDEQGRSITHLSADFAAPPWILGNQSYTFITIDQVDYIAAICTEKAIDRLILIHLKTHVIEDQGLALTHLSQIHTHRADKLVFIGSSPLAPSTLLEYDPKTKSLQSLVKSREMKIDPGLISIPETVEFPTENGKTAFAFYYPPTSHLFKSSSPDEKPPLIVFCHGGPTAHSSPTFSPAILFWTSRGFAVSLLNYGGSTGYGREYRNRLRRAWGIVDVDDSCNLALHLVKIGKVDPHKLAIRGGSAGGYTALAALTFRDVFTLGTSLYGVSNLELLAEDTHKFESRYLDSLIGHYPEERDRYRELSPLFHKDKLSRPVLLLQGAEDKIVPKSQAEEMYNALIENKIPTALIVFEGEQHGFRKAETIIRAIEAEYYFYCFLFKLPIDSSIPPLEIIPNTPSRIGFF